MEPFNLANGAVRLHEGDCLDVLPTLELVDAVVTDPPYHLTSIVKRFGDASRDDDTKTSDRSRKGADGYARLSTGFMGKKWDGGDIAFRPETWRAVLEVLKPGGHMLVFGGSRTFHRVACAIEDAGFELRDTLMWLYGTGFPKSHDVSKAIDLKERAVWFRENAEYLRPHFPNNSFHDWTVGGHAPSNEWWKKIKRLAGGGYLDRDVVACLEKAPGWFTSGTTFDITTPATEAAKQWAGWGTALKPAHEPIILARKPLTGTVAANVLEHGVGGLNIDASRVGSAIEQKAGGLHRGSDEIYGEWSGEVKADKPKGRWPANVIHDGSDEVMEGFAKYGKSTSGTSARFFYEVAPDNSCTLCYLLSSPEHGKTSSCKNVKHAGKALNPFPLTEESTVQRGAMPRPSKKLVQNVRSAGNLCDSCGTAIAQSLVASRHGQDPVLPLSRVSINECSKNILIQNLALHVENRESTDTILTIQSLTLLFGSVFYAIGEATNKANAEKRGNTGFGPTRFHYTSKANKVDRAGSKHPTVKPIKLIEYLVRLITPPKGVVLDPFAGSGTTGAAAIAGGFQAVLIEREAEYVDDILDRFGWDYWEEEDHA